MSQRNRRYLKQEDDDATFELDLSPMLALMVTLIPIMLLSTVFVKVAVIETPLPQVVAKALEQDRKKKDREVRLVVKMEQNTGLNIHVYRGSAKRSVAIPKVQGEWDFARLHKEVVQVKVENPKLFRLDLIPGKDVSYADIVKVMDEVRNTREGDPKVYIEDVDTKERVETDIMFPDVIFSNVLEG